MLNWLGQRQMQLVDGHVYRWRIFVPCPANETQIQQLLSNFGGFQWTNVHVSIDPNNLPGDWPLDRKQALPFGCMAYGEATAPSGVNITDAQVFQAAKVIGGGQLLNFWDHTSGQRLVDGTNAGCPTGMQRDPNLNLCVPGAGPPTFPPFQPPTQPPTNQPPGTSPPTIVKKKSANSVLIVAGIGIVIVGGLFLAGATR